MGVDETPGGIDAAMDVFLARRDALEREYGRTVPRPLESETRRGMELMRQPL
jgi:hypothetical protein